MVMIMPLEMSGGRTSEPVYRCSLPSLCDLLLTTYVPERDSVASMSLANAGPRWTR